MIISNEPSLNFGWGCLCFSISVRLLKKAWIYHLSPQLFVSNKANWALVKKLDKKKGKLNLKPEGSLKLSYQFWQGGAMV